MGISRYFSLGFSEPVKLSSVESSSVGRCNSSSSSLFRICTPSIEEANGRSAVFSAYTIIQDVILMKELVLARSP